MTNSFHYITSPVSTFAKEAMQLRKVRNTLINSNLANIDTPGYKARDLRFEGFLAQKAQALFQDQASSKKLKLAATSYGHMDPLKSELSTANRVFFRDGHGARNDGNTVDLDTETTEMAKNATAYKALAAFVKKQGGLFAYALESSAKLS